jgi:hypothetical protein
LGNFPDPVVFLPVPFVKLEKLNLILGKLNASTVPTVNPRITVARNLALIVRKVSTQEAQQRCFPVLNVPQDCSKR